MKKFLLILALITNWVFSYSQTEEYKATLSKLMDVSGTFETYRSVFPKLIDTYKKSFPSVPSEFWTQFEREVLNNKLMELNELLIPVYYKYYSLDDLNELIKFYQTDIGKKMVKNNPFVMEESMKIGYEWGFNIGKDIAERVKAKGY